MPNSIEKSRQEKMTKIYLIAEKIKNPMAFIRKMRALTHKPISEIRDCLANKKPFFEASVIGNEGPENEKTIQDILRFAKKQGDKLKILEQVTKEPYEITEEAFHNSIKMNDEIDRQFEEMDKLDGEVI